MTEPTNDALATALEALDAARREMAEAKEECTVSRMQDFLDAPLLACVKKQVSLTFHMESRAHKAEAALENAKRLLGEEMIQHEQNLAEWINKAHEECRRAEAAEAELAALRASRGPQDGVVAAAESYALKCVKASGQKFDISELNSLKAWFYAGAAWAGYSDNLTSSVARGPQEQDKETASDQG